MAKKPATVHVCQSCGATSPRWLGRCSACGAWGSLVEEAGRTTSSSPSRRKAGKPKKLGEVTGEETSRITTGLTELDRVLGGGIVPGGVVLLGGDPGAGKSTLLLQAIAAVAGAGRAVLYATGEESEAQVGLRAERLSLTGLADVSIVATTELDDLEALCAELHPEVVVVDSIQTMRSAALDSAPGTVSQLREVTARLVDLAKRDTIALFLVGHVTKEGAIAGPKVLEHLVDTVLELEGDRSLAYRIVRVSKNRFGPAHELAVFEMVREGLREVPDPSALFLSERPSHASGSVVVPIAEGHRALLVELQALVAPAAYGGARRVVSGLDTNRLAILLAVLDRKAGCQVLDCDVFASVAGGARVEERAADLGLAVAIVSSLRDRGVSPELAVFGEIGLAGEVRAVGRASARIAEARKLGFRSLVLPRANAQALTPDETRGLDLRPVASVVEALAAAFER